MIPDYAALIFFCLLMVCIFFIGYSLYSRKRQHLIQKLYMALCLVFTAWPVAMLGIRYTDPGNMQALFCWDAFSYLGATFTPVIMLLIAVTFVHGKEALPKGWPILLAVPIITNIVVWTNPLHHLQYRVFSIVRSEIIFGPYIYVSGLYTYLCLICATIVLIRFGMHNNSRLYRMQAAMLVLGEAIPLIVSASATFSDQNLSISATPLSFTATLVCNYIAIYRLHLLDIVPIATQHVLDWIPDGYLVLNERGLVVDQNRPFREVFGKLYGVVSNKQLEESLESEGITNKTPLYNLISAVQSCGKNGTPIAYEQAITMTAGKNEVARKYYYMVDITPLEIEQQLSGFVVIFKDITQIKRSMQQVQEGQARMLEQDRLAFLGQMVGGLAHNLKTPIMSIAGCAAAVETLITEAQDSLGDPEVTDEDYDEIYGEVGGWLSKIRSSCSYMSDIITAIKGQAANVNTSEEREFTLDELIKRTTLLMRHELQSSGCKLMTECDTKTRVTLHGDINNLIQVMNNLISNAIDAERDCERKEICIGWRADESHLSLYVKDTGHGVEPRVRTHLFQEMITTKGTKGTGLGLYISNSVVRGKFGGFMWVEDNLDGGAVFGFSIPIETVMMTSFFDDEEAHG
ncbi:MAG: histidine kinase N-terminal 7TM domain-containing protein [Pseudoflavonifractor sp.]|nr:histidine kinase N-terminal 7TM domain-containing protein [Pseudoflavonifractor sp.]